MSGNPSSCSWSRALLCAFAPGPMLPIGSTPKAGNGGALYPRRHARKERCSSSSSAPGQREPSGTGADRRWPPVVPGGAPRLAADASTPILSSSPAATARTVSTASMDAWTEYSAPPGRRLGRSRGVRPRCGPSQQRPVPRQAGPQTCVVARGVGHPVQQKG
jgi:hypothetical protein